MKRCRWVNEKNSRYIKYHDEEWGVPSHEDTYLFEMLVLESFQAGLSWECVLNKREALKKAFSHFDVQKVADFNNDKIEELMQNKEIIRNRLKIKAAIQNAKIFLEIQKEFTSFDNYIWSFNKGNILYGNGTLTTNALSDKVSLDLKTRGMKFVGSTIIYSYLQAIGVINDHEEECSYRN